MANPYPTVWSAPEFRQFYRPPYYGLEPSAPGTTGQPLMGTEPNIGDVAPGVPAPAPEGSTGGVNAEGLTGMQATGTFAQGGRAYGQGSALNTPAARLAPMVASALTGVPFGAVFSFPRAVEAIARLALDPRQDVRLQAMVPRPIAPQAEEGLTEGELGEAVAAMGEAAAATPTGGLAESVGPVGEASGPTGVGPAPGVGDTGESADFRIGGLVSGKKGRVEQGEFVVNSAAARTYLPLLHAINATGLDPMLKRMLGFGS